MSEKIYSINEIKEKIKPIAESFGVERIYLFGSYARGDATSQSDIDFRVDKGRVRGFAFGGLINAISAAFDKEVDVVTTASLDREFLNQISQEEVLLYALNPSHILAHLSEEFKEKETIDEWIDLITVGTT